MGIYYHRESHIFYLNTPDTSYVMQVLEGGWLAHLYWGRRVEEIHPEEVIRVCDRAFSGNPEPFHHDRRISLDTLPLEYPAFGNTDFRAPAVQVQLDNGTTVSDFRFSGYEISQGKPGIQGLPATYAEADTEADTLTIFLEDALTGLCAQLQYTVRNDMDVITRNVKLTHKGHAGIRILRVLSAALDMPAGDYEMLQLSGAWARERHNVRRSLVPGMHSVESRRGASSHQHNPFMALMTPGAGETHGEVWSMNLVYSGNFLAMTEVDQFGSPRMAIGINPFDFSWLLNPGEDFQTPEAVLVYSPEGLGAMSRTYHRLYRTRLVRGEHRDKSRPVLINNWEATYFEFDAEKITAIARTAAGLGVELMVLDDGWFGCRNDDNSSLGDWTVDRRKLPEGLDALARGVEAMGMKFGLWFEPEMVSEDSDLYRAHPDWCLHVPGRSRSTSRNQLILDLSRKEVCEAVSGMVKEILASAPVSYVKWDMNRHMTEVGSAALPPERQRETAHRYMLNLYAMMEDITQSFPHVLFESCSGGGGRFDPGILYYMPQTWTSDDTDAVERLKIQYGTSMVYPPSTMGAHVSAVPNHQVHRITPLETRGLVALSGNFGYELDLAKLTQEEQELVRRQVALCKEVRHVVQFGEFYRLVSPFERGGNETAWMSVSGDGSEAFVMYARVMAVPNGPQTRFRLAGLDPARRYRVMASGKVYRGDELMYSGLLAPDLQGDYAAFGWHLKAE